MKLLKELRMLLSVTAACGLLSTACVREPAQHPVTDDGQGKENFDYATRAQVILSVDYSMQGNKALFEVYDREPVFTDENGILRKKEGIHALLKAYTDKDSRYTGMIDLPTAADKIYLYSETYGLPTCVEADVIGNRASFNLKQFLATLRGENGGAAAPPSPARAFSAENPYDIQYLGGWDSNGNPDYLIGEMHNGYLYPTLVYPLPDGLANRIQNLLPAGKNNSQYAKPTELVNVNVTRDARITMVFFSEQAAWRNAIGYYYYDTNNPPRTQAELDRIPKYIAFPNCSQWNWNPGLVGSYMPPLYGGEQLQLLYHLKSGKTTEVFPKGVTIGWFILPDGFEVSASGAGKLNTTGSKHGIRYSNNEFNEGGNRYCVSVYDRPSTKTVIGFEDGSDNDYKDVLFYLEADPTDAIYDTDRPVTDPTEQYPDVAGDPIEGTLAFEDLWPSQGDYDMNDVVIRYSTTFTTDKNNRVVSIKDVFTPLYNGGQMKNAFGYQLDVPVSEVLNVRIENGSSTAYTDNGLEKGHDKAVVMLFDDMSAAVAKGPITVTVKLKKGALNLKDITRASLYNPFICVNGSAGFMPGQLRKEIHLTDYAPTALADPYPFGRNDDRSTVDKDGNPIGPYYYVTSDLHPFAIDLPITDYRIPDEMVSIDNYYTHFAAWAGSKGEKYKDWYLYPAVK